MIHQLNPALPCVVSSKDNKTALALFLIDYGPAHDLLWVVSLCESGEVWCIPNWEIRLKPNFTYADF